MVGAREEGLPPLVGEMSARTKGARSEVTPLDSRVRGNDETGRGIVYRLPPPIL